MKNRESIRLQLLNYTKRGVAFTHVLEIQPIQFGPSGITHFVGTMKDWALADVEHVDFPRIIAGSHNHDMVFDGSLPFAVEDAVKQESVWSRAITVSSPPFGIIHVNATWCETWGYELEEVLRKPIAILNGPATCPATLTAVNQAAQSCLSICCRLIHYTKAGLPCMSILLMQPLVCRVGPANGITNMLFEFRVEQLVSDVRPMVFHAAADEPVTDDCSMDFTLPSFQHTIEILADSAEEKMMSRQPTNGAILISDLQRFVREILPRKFNCYTLAEFNAVLHRQCCELVVTDSSHNRLEFMFSQISPQVQQSEQPIGAWTLAQVKAAEQNLRKTCNVPNVPPAHLPEEGLLSAASLPSLSRFGNSEHPEQIILSKQSLQQLEQQIDDEMERYDATLSEFIRFRIACEQRIHQLCVAMVNKVPRLLDVSAEQLASQADVVLNLLRTT